MQNQPQDPKIVDAEKSGILLDERGRWFHHGQPVENAKISEFFHRSIRKDDSGNYYLHNEMGTLKEMVYFQVEDTAYFVHHLAMDQARQKLFASLNTGEAVEIDPKSLTQDSREVMYCKVLQNDRARLTTNALHDLSELVYEEDDGIFLEIEGRKFKLA